ncbi:bifunctional 3-(3-hydroxy-phenyl)propionate/3-hydroxycinnamic acid hydroxylase [Actinomadura macrotermitis]|uniref:3-(3-hydroxy-phenyl)propionate/3-hydroxycinnamic acid hydroxylase n=1 Tax=Actinomadura macrotermitis TaxID=2585200 RepID=A0A7K0BYM0_9ACTN|nr:bifunctional 3-(3-hydroxy-phenyl)propionate/3-hydroxycinnamic acid hydroxylase [Actinomadura macrotermitis]MQY06281.1 3-(3-hydroxy-phenyl)propionate/3-hydroxycinnamic acid hydroxylase [Actinomadura macrotermitis]
MTSRRETEIVIVGYGPVGQVLAVLLAQAGREVLVLERWPDPYPLPRAVAYDAESARILATTGVDPSLGPNGRPLGDYVWRNQDGVELLAFTGLHEVGPQGWPAVTSMYQPGLEDALIARGAELPGLTVLRGHEVIDVAADGDTVTVTATGPAGERLSVTASWAIGCDGANSAVRRALGTPFEERGFSHDWLICDITTGKHYDPDNLQICDPARPRTSVAAGPGHRRWEFMRIAGETLEELNTPEAAWRLLELGGESRAEATLDRHAVYTFRAGHAARWRDGRILLAGDAAHLMPPFAGQGLCSGFRDARNLAWKLNLIQDGRADADLLDTYTEERRAHVQAAIDRSVELGRVICEPDPAAAAARDAELLAARAGDDGPVLEVQRLHGGLLHQGSAAAGDLAPNGTVTRGGRTARLDEIAGTGFVLLTSVPPETLLDPARLDLLASLGGRAVHVVPAGGDHDGRAVADTGETLLPFLAGHDAQAVLIRPDFYVYGAATGPDGTAALLDGLRDRLGARTKTRRTAMGNGSDAVRGFYADWGRGDLDAAVAVFGPEAVWHAPPGLEDVELSGVAKGPEEIGELLAREHALLESRPEPDEIVEADDRVVVFGTAALRGSLTGVTGTAPFTHVWRFAGGQAVEVTGRHTTGPVRELLAADGGDGLRGLSTDFMLSQVLRSAVDLGVFPALADGPLPAAELADRVGLHPRGALDFLDTLAALGLLARADGRYGTTPVTARYLADPDADPYLGGLLGYVGRHWYWSWGRLPEALRTGESQSYGGAAPYDAIHADPEVAADFQRAMAGASTALRAALAGLDLWQGVRTVTDIGCADGALLSRVLATHPHLTGTGFDLPTAEPGFRRAVARYGTADRLRFAGGDFRTDPFPPADAVLLAHVLIDWDEDVRRLLLRRAFDALPEGGTVLIVDTLVEDARDAASAAGLLVSLHMLVDQRGGPSYTAGEVTGWLADAGFRDVRVRALSGFDRLVTATR